MIPRLGGGELYGISNYGVYMAELISNLTCSNLVDKVNYFLLNLVRKHAHTSDLK